jgi:hypothetical protein
LLLLACSIFGPPGGAEDAAIEEVKAGCVFGTTCKDHEVTRSEKEDLNSADEANDITEKWCIEVTYLWDFSGRWEESRAYSRVEKVNSNWKARVGPPCMR